MQEREPFAPRVPRPRVPPASPNNSALLLSAPSQSAPKTAPTAPPSTPPLHKPEEKQRLIGLGAAGALVLVAAALVLPVYFVVVRKNHSSSTAVTASRVSDPTNLFNNDTRPTSWTPPLNTLWSWG
ncbi:hypothetical protein B0H10DRAFT_2238999 [Mycena sp. CBHHK59/15]|nr:hypothetical protein B0H10DRAFT_2238999 [Mycena sp. CBHHK59/15]